jgi:hypothetical protein
VYDRQKLVRDIRIGQLQRTEPELRVEAIARGSHGVTRVSDAPFGHERF